MFSMKDGSLRSRSTKGASAFSRRRSVSRGVTSSGRVAKTGLLESGQTVAELDPADIVAEPRMVRGRKRPGRIQAARSDVHEVRGVEVLVHQRRSAGPAEPAPHL